MKIRHQTEGNKSLLFSSVYKTFQSQLQISNLIHNCKQHMIKFNPFGLIWSNRSLHCTHELQKNRRRFAAQAQNQQMNAQTDVC